MDLALDFEARFGAADPTLAAGQALRDGAAATRKGAGRPPERPGRALELRVGQALAIYPLLALGRARASKGGAVRARPTTSAAMIGPLPPLPLHRRGPSSAGPRLPFRHRRSSARGLASNARLASPGRRPCRPPPLGIARCRRPRRPA